MSQSLNRRRFFGVAASAAATMAIGACSSTSSGSSSGSSTSGSAGGSGAPADISGTLRATSYGDPTKLKLRSQVVDKFNSEFPKIHVTFEGSPTTGYFDKLATQISAGSPPDVINIDPVHAAQYVASNALEPLDGYSNIVQTDTFDKNLLAQGVQGGKLYGLPVAVSTYGIGYDTTKLAELKIDFPSTWTYDEYADLMVKIHQAAGGNFYGSEDMSYDLPSLEVWLRTQNKALYQDAKTIGFSADDLTHWFSYWSDLRGKGGCVTEEIQASHTYDDNTGGPMIQGKCAVTHIITPNFTGAFQKLTKNLLKMTDPPTATAGGKHGSYQSPSSIMTVTSASKNKEAAVTMVNFFCNSPDSAAILRFISGPMASSAAIKGVEGGQTTAAENEVIRFTQASPQNALPAPPLPPANGSQVATLLIRVSQDVGFGKQTPAAAASSFIDQANALLAKTS